MERRLPLIFIVEWSLLTQHSHSLQSDQFLLAALKIAATAASMARRVYWSSLIRVLLCALNSEFHWSSRLLNGQSARIQFCYFSLVFDIRNDDINISARSSFVVCSVSYRFSCSNMRYANGGEIRHHHQSRRRYVELPSELTDRSPGSDTVLKNSSQ
jgi:hypothetical protein